MTQKTNSNKETMSRDELETYFTSIQERFAEVDKRFIEVDKRFDGVDKRFDEVDKRFDEQDKKLNIILELMQFYDADKKDIKVTLWEHDRRLSKLEQKLT